MTQYQLPFNNPDLADGFGSMMSPRTRPHRGLDFAQSVGTNYPTIADGVIAGKGYSGELGYYTAVGHPDGMFSGYCHSNQPSPFEIGAVVTRGTTINQIGNMGFITGPHLHLTLSTTVYGVSYGQVQDPYPYIQARLGADPVPDPELPPPAPVASNVWSTNPGLRPETSIISMSGKIRITISAYGAGALVTYAIPDVRPRSAAIASVAAQRSQLLLNSDEFGESTGTKTWIQNVPVGKVAVVGVECYGFRPGAFVASPSLVVEVVY